MSKSNRFENNPLVTTYDEKYGNYDYSKDLRSYYKDEFKESFSAIINTYIPDRNESIIISGANDGYEIDLLLKEGYGNICGLDISQRATEKLINRFSVKGAVGDMQNTTFKDSEFGNYICMRAIHSSCVDIDKALIEAQRITVTGGIIYLSISNGYLIDGLPKKGMYVYDQENISITQPYQRINIISNLIGEKNIIDIIDMHSEIGIIINNTKSLSLLTP